MVRRSGPQSLPSATHGRPRPRSTVPSARRRSSNRRMKHAAVARQKSARATRRFRALACNAPRSSRRAALPLVASGGPGAAKMRHSVAGSFSGLRPVSTRHFTPPDSRAASISPPRTPLLNSFSFGALCGSPEAAASRHAAFGRVARNMGKEGVRKLLCQQLPSRSAASRRCSATLSKIKRRAIIRNSFCHAA